MAATGALNRKFAISALWAAALCLQPWPGVAQTNMAGHVMETRDEIPPDQLPPPRRMTGIGNGHMRISATPEAQVWFDQGLSLLHDFWDYESARAFEQAVRVDPQCAMCYWGLYKAESFYHGTEQGYAGQALAKAVGLKDRASAREQLYIEADAARQEAMKSPNPGPKLTEERDLRHKLVREYPEDTQAQIFLSQDVDQKEALELLESVLRDRPDDSAANHYYIHALEATDPERALHSAEILGSLAPASGHIVHMPGHIFFRLGDYARAEQAFAASMRADERYMKEQHVPPDDDWNYVHNIMYAVANLMEEGKLKEATEVSAKLTVARGELEPTLYIYSARDSISRLNPRLPVALRMADWAGVIELLKATAPPAGAPNLDFLARELVEFATGMRAAESHNVGRAEDSSARFDAELWRMSQQAKDAQPMGGMPRVTEPAKGPPKLRVNPDALLQPIVSTLSIMSLELRASLLIARNQVAEAKALFARAEEEEKELGYHEPPNYIRPVAETEAAEMMAIGDWSDAMDACKRALKERPKSGLVLYKMAWISEKSGDSAAAAKDYKDFLAAWKDADPSLAQVKHARAWLEHLRG